MTNDLTTRPGPNDQAHLKALLSQTNATCVHLLMFSQVSGWRSEGDTTFASSPFHFSHQASTFAALAAAGGLLSAAALFSPLLRRLLAESCGAVLR